MHVDAWEMCLCLSSKTRQASQRTGETPKRRICLSKPLLGENEPCHAFEVWQPSRRGRNLETAQLCAIRFAEIDSKMVMVA